MRDFCTHTQLICILINFHLFLYCYFASPFLCPSLMSSLHPLPLMASSLSASLPLRLLSSLWMGSGFWTSPSLSWPSFWMGRLLSASSPWRIAGLLQSWIWKLSRTDHWPAGRSKLVISNQFCNVNC